ncbi:hypothetical protein QFC20_002718 [Naganishia adeliensis]|uniref:Uncharacterized protein n=1 Tax=Naganishia adeliensis TaxID=92952 RepID=A0ACC2WIQ4_9TREE|nr:hypothetical protein QFC20_002718 [Naganishia adeliensis]
MLTSTTANKETNRLAEENDQHRILIEIFEPQDIHERRHLVAACFDEILNDWGHDVLLGNGINTPRVIVHHLQQADIEEAISSHGQISGLPLLLVDHLIRHDWHHTGDCLNAVRIVGNGFRGPVERLKETELEGTYDK